jgi:AcrR family transcriptional regulator
MSPRGADQNEQMRAQAMQRISEAALEEFAAYGYHGATMRRIAASAGLSSGLLYHYFPSKEKVFKHLVDFALEGSLAGLRGALSTPGTAWQRIEAHAALVVGSMFEGKTSFYFLIMLQAMTQGKSVPGLPARLSKRMDVFYEILPPVIAEAQAAGDAAPGDPIALAAAYFSLIQGLATLIFQGRGHEKLISPAILCSVLRNPGKTAP